MGALRKRNPLLFGTRYRCARHHRAIPADQSVQMRLVLVNGLRSGISAEFVTERPRVASRPARESKICDGTDPQRAPAPTARLSARTTCTRSVPFEHSLDTRFKPSQRDAHRVVSRFCTRSARRNWLASILSSLRCGLADASQFSTRFRPRPREVGVTEVDRVRTSGSPRIQWRVAEFVVSRLVRYCAGGPRSPR